MDTVNSTLAHGPETRLPSPFYDKKGVAIIDKIGVEEWFDGFKESNEYRTVGIGALAGDIVARMIGSIDKAGHDGLLEIGGESGALGRGRGGETALKFAMSGCHDTSLAGLLASLGAFEKRSWPPYSSHVAVELFTDTSKESSSTTDKKMDTIAAADTSRKQSWRSKLLPFQGSSKKLPSDESSAGFSRKPLAEWQPQERDKLEGYYVRIRYNDEPVTIPACKEPGNHLEGEETFCTLVGF